MSSYTVINGTTRTLASFLLAETGVPVDNDRAPNDTIADATPLIHLYLYRVEINPFFTNDDWVRPSPQVREDPPIGLNLLYVITPYGSGQLEIQLTLGEVIHVFHRNPIIPPAHFDASLADTTQELRVVPRPLSLEQMTEFWRSFDQRSYRLSVAYEVSAVLIDTGVSREVVPVEERRLEVGQLR